jgi:predicted peroxiredoxin
MKKLLVLIALGLALPVHAQSSTELFLMLNSGHAQTQGMALVLATQASEQKASVRILLCSEGGQLALRDKESVTLKPRNVTPKEMLQALMKAGARVEVCALFLPNSDWKQTDLIDGVAVAKPAEVASHMLLPQVKVVSY